MSQWKSGLSRLARWSAVAAVVAVALGGCGDDDSPSSSSSSSNAASTADGKSAVRVGLAQIDSKNDHGFSQLIHEGASLAEQRLGIKLTEIDSLTTPSAQQTALKNLARANELVLFNVSMAIQSIPETFPRTHFVEQNGVMKGGANTHSQVQDWWPVAYLAGVAAAEASKTGVVGYIGGIRIPPIVQAEKGYTAGAKSVDPSIKVISTTTGSFSDSAKGKAAAQAQIAGGADVLFANLNTAHTGIVQAAKASGKDVRVIGSILPKCDISQGLDVGDTLFDQSKITYATIKEYVDDRKLPRVLAFGLRGGYSIFKVCPGASPALKKALATATAGLLSGEIKP